MLGFLGWHGLDDEMTLFDAVGQALVGRRARRLQHAHRSRSPRSRPITQYVILVFMVIAGINFLRLYRFFVQRRVDVLARDEELRLYLALIADRHDPDRASR